MNCVFQCMINLGIQSIFSSFEIQIERSEKAIFSFVFLLDICFAISAELPIYTYRYQGGVDFECNAMCSTGCQRIHLGDQFK